MSSLQDEKDTNVLENENYTYFQKYKVKPKKALNVNVNIENKKDFEHDEVDNKMSKQMKQHKPRRPMKLSNVDVNECFTLGLPPQYKGSQMFMPTGERLYWQAEVISSSQKSVTCQDFNEIRCQCLNDGVLFEDPEFPATDSILHPKGHHFNQRYKGPVKWLRPGDLVDYPKLFVKGYSRFDVNQGHLGDCWVNSALASLTMSRKLFNQVVPRDQSFDEEDYAGIFHFRFWQYGRWVDVVIDDRLPTTGGKLLFLHSSTNNEFWGSLLEKAYAKLYGSYGAIWSGGPSEAMEDFTGGLAERYRVSNLSMDFFDILKKAHVRNSLINASTDASQMMQCGLRGHHAYSITCVRYIEHLECETPLIRLRNPWGKSEWEGAWSDKSSEWTDIPQWKRETMGLTVDDDGEFWMSYQDFTEHFSVLHICNLNPECLYPENYPDDCDKKWDMSMFEGEWVKGETAGGSYLSDTYWINPQYIVTLEEPEQGDVEDPRTMIIFLTQKYTRNLVGQKLHSIGFRVYEAGDEDCCPFDTDFFIGNDPVDDIPFPRYSRSRVFNARLEVVPGRYLIVPYISEPGLEGEFLLRVLTEKEWLD